MKPFKFGFVVLLSLLIGTIRTEDQDEEQIDLVTAAFDSSSSSSSVPPLLPDSELKLEHELVMKKHQADQPSSNEFVAIHVDAVGARETINPRIQSLAAMAIRFLPTDFRFVEVLSASREIVAGVRYHVYAKALEVSSGEEVICYLNIFEKPWLVTESGEKLRVLHWSNCSRDDANNETIDETQYKVNPLYSRPRETQDLSEDQLRDLESQIVIPRTKVFSTTQEALIEQVTSRDVFAEIKPEVTSEVPVSNLHSQIHTTIERIFNQNLAIQRAIDEIAAGNESIANVQRKYEAVFEELVQAIAQNVFTYAGSNPNDSFTYVFPVHLNQPETRLSGVVVYVEKDNEVETVTTELPDLPRSKRDATEEERRALLGSENGVRMWLGRSRRELIDSSCVENCDKKVEREKRGIPGGINSLSASEFDNLKPKINAGISGLGSVKSLSTDYKITEASTQVVSGTLIRCKIEFNDGKTCSVQIWEQPWLNNGSEYTWKCDDGFEHKHRARRDAAKGPLLGGETEMERKELENLKPTVLDTLIEASSKNADKNYNFHKIVSGTKQIVSGVSYRLVVETKDDQGDVTRCQLKIWSQPWRKDQPSDVNMRCGDEFRYRSRQRRSVRVKRQHVQRYSSKGEEHMRNLFDKFKLKHKRHYHTNREHQERYRIFKTNLQRIDELNQNEEGTAKYGITEFADLTKEEFAMRTGLVSRTRKDNELSNPLAEIDDQPLPKSFDWRDRGAVSGVKNQGMCGSCWAFSVVGNIEGLHAIKTGQLEEYSEQELLDCDTTDGACNGGEMDDAYKAIEKIGGLETESDYPYEAKKHSCRFNQTLSHVAVRGAVDLPANETKIAQFLVQNGPLSIGLNANAMQFYRGGVSKPFKFLCSPKQMDHGVVLVGFGVSEYPKFKKTLPYWIIKNSWGARWGEQGYYRLYRGDNRCGVANMVSSAVL